MGENAALTRELREAVVSFRAESGIAKVIVFGSRAAGRGGDDSDVDLLLIDERFEGIKPFRRARGLHRHWKLDIPVDFLCYTPQEFETLRHRRTLAHEASEHGVTVEG